MTSKKTGYLLGAVAGAGVMAAAVAGAGMRLPYAHADQAPQLIKASTAPIFAPPPGAPMSFADIFAQVSPAVVSINVTSRVDASALRRIPGFEGLPFGGGQAPDGDDDNSAPPQGGGVHPARDVDRDHRRRDLGEDVGERHRRAGRRREDRRGRGLDQMPLPIAMAGRSLEGRARDGGGQDAGARDGAQEIAGLLGRHRTSVPSAPLARGRSAS